MRCPSTESFVVFNQQDLQRATSIVSTTTITWFAALAKTLSILTAPWARRLALISEVGTPRPLPTALLGGATRCRSVAIGHRHVVVATHAGVVYTYGSASHGQLGRAIHADEPNTPFLDSTGCAVRSACVEPLRAERVVAVAAGACHSLALTSTGALYAWGHDALGQCGVRAAPAEAKVDGPPNPFRVRHPYIRLLPAEVHHTGRGERAPRVARIGASQSASAAVTATGLLYAAGTRGFSRAERDGARCSARGPGPPGDGNRRPD